MPKYRIVYKQTVTLAGEAEAERLEEVFDSEIMCLGPGSDDACPEIRYLLIEEIDKRNPN